MSKVLPSQLVEAIDSLFGANRKELDGRAVTHVYRAEVHALLALLDEVPRELIDLPTVEYLEFTRCRAVLATSLVRWNLGDIAPARDVGGRDAVERIRRLMKRCNDELPHAEPELPFISDADIRLGIEDRIHAAWTDFNAREWMGTTVFAGAALEALLLWALKRVKLAETPKRPLDELHLAFIHGRGVYVDGFCGDPKVHPAPGRPFKDRWQVCSVSMSHQNYPLVRHGTTTVKPSPIS